MTIWKPIITDKNRPIYQGLADAIESDIKSGHLSAGMRLPSHRDLADHLGVTVGTITRGYAEAARRGLVRGEIGRGTVVLPDGDCQPVFYLSEKQEAGLLDFTLTTTISHLDPDPGPVLKSLSRKNGFGGVLGYQPAIGRVEHREAGREWLGEFGVHADIERVVITAGAQHAIFSVCSALFRPKDTVFAEEHTYPGMINACSMLGLNLLPIRCDEDGIVPEALEQACIEEGGRGLFLMPSMQNPTATNLPARRREKVAEIADKYDLSLIEDDSYRFSQIELHTPIADMIPDRTFFIGGMSKFVSPGLRIAYVGAPEKYIRRLAGAITWTMFMASPLCAEVAAEWIRDGTARRVMLRKREEGFARRELAEAVFEPLRLRKRFGGYFVWVELPECLHCESFVREAYSRGVGVVSVGRFAVNPAVAANAVRISLSSARTREELARGLGILKDLLSDPTCGGGCVF